MKAIILAAGYGKRMGALTANIPKTLVEFHGKTLLEYKTDVLLTFGISDIMIVTGYQYQQFEGMPWHLIHNNLYKTTNMMYSLMLALNNMDDDVVVCYGDIIFEADVLKQLLASDGAFSVVIDLKYYNYWSLRMNNLLNDIESCDFNETGRLLEIGNPVQNTANVKGQYIGLFRISKEMIRVVRNLWQLFLEEKGSEAGEKTSVTPFLNWMIKQNEVLQVVLINNKWLEFDTYDDYTIYNKAYNEGTLQHFFNVEGYKELTVNK